MSDAYKARQCGPLDGVKAAAEGDNVKQAVQSAFLKALEICQLFGGCDKLNPRCLFEIRSLEIEDAPNGKQKATASGLCRCGQYTSLPGESL
jgi:hypothetical protein